MPLNPKKYNLENLTRLQFCELTGYDPGRLSNLIKDGKLGNGTFKIGKRVHIHYHKALAGIIRNTEDQTNRPARLKKLMAEINLGDWPEAVHKNSVHKKSVTDLRGFPTLEDLAIEDLGAQLPETKAKADIITAAYAAERVKLKLKTESGELVEAEKIEFSADFAGRLVRDTILSISDRTPGIILGSIVAHLLEKIKSGMDPIQAIKSLDVQTIKLPMKQDLTNILADLPKIMRDSINSELLEEDE